MKEILIIDGIPPTINTMLTKHWRTYKRYKDEWKETTYYTALSEKIQKFTNPVTITIELNFKDKRRHDPDNYTPKFIHDGLVDAGVLEDDSFKQIKELTIREGDKKNNTTVVYIEEKTKFEK